MRLLPKKVRVLVLVAAAGTTFDALTGCDPAVRDTVLGGVESASTGLAATFIQAFFQTLTNDTPTSTNTPSTTQGPAFNQPIFA